MTVELLTDHRIDPQIYEPDEGCDLAAGLSRRDFVQVLGAGLLITVTGEMALRSAAAADGVGAAAEDSSDTGRPTSPPGCTSTATGRSPCLRARSR